MVRIKHDDHHNEPYTEEFPSLEEAAKYISRLDPLGDSAEEVLRYLKQDGQYIGCDDWDVV